MDVLVIGAGVVGLSTGIRLLSAGHGVSIWARERPPHTTSDVAAAIWYPYRALPENKVTAWAAFTYRELQKLTSEPRAGVTMRSGLELLRGAQAEPWWKDAVPGFREARPDELPSGFVAGHALKVPVAEMPRYLPFLLFRFFALGGRLELRELGTLDEALRAHPVVVNCSGLGARELVPDGQVTPVRGQVVRVEQSGVDRFWIDDHGPEGMAYVIPRSADVVLGGTAEEGREDIEPDEAEAQAIVRRCALLDPRLARSRVLGVAVGLRPGRSCVRLEAEERDGRLLVHNYGHGGAGVTLSWGCAQEVAELLRAHGPRPS
jgi:D-amino-acid oxidase